MHNSASNRYPTGRQATINTDSADEEEHHGNRLIERKEGQEIHRDSGCEHPFLHSLASGRNTKGTVSGEGTECGAKFE